MLKPELVEEVIEELNDIMSSGNGMEVSPFHTDEVKALLSKYTQPQQRQILRIYYSNREVMDSIMEGEMSMMTAITGLDLELKVSIV